MKAAAALGQSIWLDQIRRDWLQDGTLAGLVKDGLRGVTSNPAIFQKAITADNAYESELKRLVLDGAPAEEIYENLILEDIRATADVLQGVFDESDGTDGFVSLEVNPHFAHDTQKTIDEARHYWRLVARPNLLIKVPATGEGLPAIQTLISEGINVNVTLMFSLNQYDLVAEAYLSGLEKRLESGETLEKIASVASFFVSRVDQKIDPILERLDRKEALSIKGKIGIANAKMAYQRFKETFQGERWKALSAQGAQLQRVLYGSTSTKNPAYPDTLYVDGLIGPDTINTIPMKTIHAFEDHGTVSKTLDAGLDEAVRQLQQLEKSGVHLDNITQQLLDEGVEKFVQPFDALIDYIVKAQTRFLMA